MLTVNILGCGRLGKTIGRLFHLHNVAKIQCVMNSTSESTLGAVNFIGEGKAVKSYDELLPADVTFITTGDKRIPLICDQLVQSGKLKPSSIIAHCSGALTSDILAAAKTANCKIASIHPIKSFASPTEALSSFPRTFCSLEGDGEAQIVLSQLFEAIGAVVFSISKENKMQYHAATTMANNYLVTLHYHAMQTLIRSGVEEPIAMSITSRLMNDALTNLKISSHKKALTGPIQRGDVDTVKQHLHAIEDGVTKNIYSALGVGTLPITTHETGVTEQFKKTLSTK